MYVVTAFGSAVGGDPRTHLVAGRSAFKRTLAGVGSGQAPYGEKYHPALGLGLGLPRPETADLYSPPLKVRAVEASAGGPPGQAPTPARTMSGKQRDNTSPISPVPMSTNGKRPSPSNDRYEPIKRLALVQIQPPRNPNKPITPFGISDILHGTVGKKGPEMCRGIVRPWDDDCQSRASSGEDMEDDDLDIEVEDVKPPKGTNGKSPLDALLQMTSKTFDGLDAGHSVDDASRRDQLNLFSKSQPPKKRRKSRTAFTNQQIYELEKRFLYQKYLTPADRDEIAQNLGLTNAQVITWFQNRRAKLKRDLEELKADVTAAKSIPVGDTQAAAATIADIDELHLYDLKRAAQGHPNGESSEGKPYSPSLPDVSEAGSPASPHVRSPEELLTSSPPPEVTQSGENEAGEKSETNVTQTERNNADSPVSNDSVVSSSKED